jgi:NitT/TauT family transport system ATP-binding protein
VSVLSQIGDLVAYLWGEVPPAPRPEGPASLTLSGVGKTFPGGTHALEGVDISVAPGEFVTIVGPSGCGKSTVLRLVSGLEKPTAGEVRLAPGNLGYVFQDATLLPWRTVTGNVELLTELHGIKRIERRKLAAEAIALAGLDGFEGHHPKQLSGGMKMRVSLARALTLKPNIFLFDEPFGALDEISRERLNGELQQLFIREGFAGLFVTHSAAEAVYLSTRVLVMSPRPGRIVADIAIPFEYPRKPSLRFEPEFGRLVGHVSANLREAAA